MQNDTPLPRLPRTGPLYLATLLVLVAAFYALLLASLGLSAYLLVRLLLWTPWVLAHQRTYGGLKLLFTLYAAVGVYIYAVLRGLSVKTGGEPGGVKLTRVRHPAAFALVEEVAARVQADPIDAIYLVPESRIGVWEETALYLPPGAGKRKIVLGMAALSVLTLDELRAILAHEYAHFSHRDTFFSRFIYRVDASCGTLLAQVREHGGWVRYLNPLYWILSMFALVYPRLAARFSRVREHYADRRAAEAYGRDLFGRSLITMYLESLFFGQVGVDGVMRTTERDGVLPNVYHFVAAARRDYERDNPVGAAAVLAAGLASMSHRLDAHPSLRERLDAQGLPETARHPSPLPRPVSVPALDALAGQDLPSGEPSAAETLFGPDAPALQAALTERYNAPYALLVQVLRHVRGGAAHEADEVASAGAAQER